MGRSKAEPLSYLTHVLALNLTKNSATPSTVNQSVDFLLPKKREENLKVDLSFLCLPNYRASFE